MKFKVGDRVRIIRYNDGSHYCLELGEEGTVVIIDHLDNIQPYGVEFDYQVIIDGVCCGNDCYRHAKNGYGWWCEEEMLELIDGVRESRNAILYEKD